MLFTADLRSFADRLAATKKVDVSVKEEDSETKIKTEAKGKRNDCCRETLWVEAYFAQVLHDERHQVDGSDNVKQNLPCISQSRSTRAKKQKGDKEKQK